MTSQSTKWNQWKLHSSDRFESSRVFSRTSGLERFSHNHPKPQELNGLVSIPPGPAEYENSRINYPTNDQKFAPIDLSSVIKGASSVLKSLSLSSFGDQFDPGFDESNERNGCIPGTAFQKSLRSSYGRFARICSKLKSQERDLYKNPEASPSFLETAEILRRNGWKISEN